MPNVQPRYSHSQWRDRFNRLSSNQVKQKKTMQEMARSAVKAMPTGVAVAWAKNSAIAAFPENKN